MFTVKFAIILYEATWKCTGETGGGSFNVDNSVSGLCHENATHQNKRVGSIFTTMVFHFNVPIWCLMIAHQFLQLILKPQSLSSCHKISYRLVAMDGKYHQFISGITSGGCYSYWLVQRKTGRENCNSATHELSRDPWKLSWDPQEVPPSAPTQS